MAAGICFALAVIVAVIGLVEEWPSDWPNLVLTILFFISFGLLFSTGFLADLWARVNK